ncbi:putative ATPase [Tilletia horrida]|uniref:ATPase n=1 Tax=Tilletia horrida TaxID=155126 RepID=A0AAN6G8W2_9BASI|nr:putative ATPase [Tilletia horrida]
MSKHEDEIIAAAKEADSLVASHPGQEEKQPQKTERAGGGDGSGNSDGDSAATDDKGKTAAKDEEGEEQQEKQQEEQQDPAESRRDEQRIAKLKFLLEKSSIYSRIMGERMEAERTRRAENAAKKATATPTASSTASSTSAAAVNGGRRGTRANPDAAAEGKQLGAAAEGRTRKKRKTDGKADGQYEISSYLDEDDLQAAKAASTSSGTTKDEAAGKKRARSDTTTAAGGEEGESRGERAQPKLLTGAKMRDYQIDGLEWLVSLYENGLNGILADEMGLGKTIQTISFFAHLRENGVWGPFLVCAPLSTITNWVLEFERFTPDIPVILYYGSAPERTELREKHKLNYLPTSQKAKDNFPIVVSSYEVIMRDRKHLASLDWKYIVVDEGHRLKNMDCKLIRELKTYRSANRLILTGTPLHNNLAELWSLLNFILPDIFDDLATFEKWFDFSDLHEEEGDGAGGNKLLSKEQSGSIITQLHAILKPFLLRRLKADVESDLPPKKEYLLYAPLTEEQKDLYEAILGKDVRRWLMERKTGLKWEEIADILEGDWEDKRATGYSYEQSARSLRQIHEDEEEDAAAAALGHAKITPIDDDDDDENVKDEIMAASGTDAPKAGAESSTRSSTTAVESPVSEASTRLGTPKAAKEEVKAVSTPRRSGRTAEKKKTAEAEDSPQPVPKRGRGRPRKSQSETSMTPTTTPKGRRKANQRDAPQPIVIDDDEQDEDFVMLDGKGPDDDDRPRRYPRRRARNEVNYSQLDVEFNERMWRQIDAAEGGEEARTLADREQSRLDKGVAAWYGPSDSGLVGAGGASSRSEKSGPSSALVRKVGKRKAGELVTELQGKKWLIREAQKEINNLHLENVVMQLRKICCHPFLFDWPVDREAGMKVVNEDLIHASGKMLMLNRLLDALFARGHKVLIFSQFTTMLDIIEDWATEYKKLRICRIDGSTSQELRRSQMKSFNEETGPDACNLFLLSTRAGGLGINLVSADTVIFYDSDWNPQMDLQAQDRVHRIGQKRPVLIFRLVSANTVEQKILKRAGNKRKLEALVIQQGKFKLPAGVTKNALTGRGGTGGPKEESLAEMAAALLRLDGERVQLARKGDEIISDANLERLLDRSPAAYQRQRGWVSSVDGGEHEGGSTAKGAGGKKEAGVESAAFEVTSTEVEGDVNDVVARLMAGEEQAA